MTAKTHNRNWYLFRWNFKAFKLLLKYIHYSLASLPEPCKYKCFFVVKGLGKPVKHSVKHQCLTNVWLVFLSLKIDVWRCLMRKSCLMKVYFKINFSSNIFEFDQTIFCVCIVFHYFIKQVKKSSQSNHDSNVLHHNSNVFVSKTE